MKREALAACREAVGLSQEALAQKLGVANSTVFRWEAGDSTPLPRQRPPLAAALQVPLGDLADLLRPSGAQDSDPGPNEPTVTRNAAAPDPVQEPGSGGTPPDKTPTLTPDELEHLAAALGEARYVDPTSIRNLRRSLALYAAGDGETGPRHALPPVLGVAAAVERHVRDVLPPVRSQLLAVGARAAELAGWLCRDIGDRTAADHWRDRAFEWAAEAGDMAMCGYVLLKKSQAAWDDRDVARMLSLAQASQRPAWRIPPRVRAEACQQEARGHAMLCAPLLVVNGKLDEAYDVLTAPDDEADADDVLPLAGHYTPALLTLQTAICHTEAGRAATAVDLYRQWLSENHFSRRDYGYFLALMATTLAKADDAAEAARTGLRSRALAAETSSARTMGELRQLATNLAPWASLPDVRDLREAVRAS